MQSLPSQPAAASTDPNPAPHGDPGAIARTLADAQYASTPAPAGHRRLLAAAATLWRREIQGFVRQRSRLLSALLTPVLFWIMLGSGVYDGWAGPSEADAPGQSQVNVSYLQYLFPGVILMILLFSSIFSTISVIEERREGFLQGVLVSPAPRLAIVLGKVLGGATLAGAQAVLFLILWPLIAGDLWSPSVAGLGQLSAAVGVILLSAAAMTAAGLCLAWVMNSTAGFHAVMMLLLMPLWFLSGAVFPRPGAAPWLEWLMAANPITYAHTALARLMSFGRIDPGAPASTTLCVAVVLASTAVMLVLAQRIVAHRPHAAE